MPSLGFETALAVFPYLRNLLHIAVNYVLEFQIICSLAALSSPPAEYGYDAEGNAGDDSADPAQKA